MDLFKYGGKSLHEEICELTNLEILEVDEKDTVVTVIKDTKDPLVKTYTPNETGSSC